MVKNSRSKFKYFAKPTVVDGIKFDSKTEAEWYVRLKDAQNKGVISDLELQPKFEIIPKLVKKVEVKLKTKVKTVERVEERNAVYTADFKFIERATGQIVIMEIKSKGSALARDYPLRKKLIKKKISEWNDSEGCEKYVFKEIVQS